VARHWKRWLLVGAIVGVAGVAGGPFVYINFIEKKAPDPLNVTPASRAAASGPAVPADRTWKVGRGSQAGYRVKEVLFGQHTEAVGRTGSVTGDIGIHGTKVTRASFTVDMATVASDRRERDGQFRGRIMDTSKYPKATFTLTKPINLGSQPKVGAEIRTKATGRLTLKAATRDVTFDVTASPTSTTSFEVSGSIPVKFARWNIASPNLGFVQTENNGQVEFLLKFTKS
jgi:polyisoprenoid-binding protein YceI